MVFAIKPQESVSLLTFSDLKALHKDVLELPSLHNIGIYYISFPRYKQVLWLLHGLVFTAAIKGPSAQHPSTPLHKTADPRLLMISTDVSCTAREQEFRTQIIAEVKMSLGLVAHLHFDETWRTSCILKSPTTWEEEYINCQTYHLLVHNFPTWQPTMHSHPVDPGQITCINSADKIFTPRSCRMSLSELKVENKSKFLCRWFPWGKDFTA